MDDEEEDEEWKGAIDVNTEAAILPSNTADVTMVWLQNEDVEADRTIRQMLPIDHLTFECSCDPDTFTGQREDSTASPVPTLTLDD